MMPKFGYNDIVSVKAGRHVRSGEPAWVVGVFQERLGQYFEQFPPGVIYTVEFQDGSSTEVHEDSLEAAKVHTNEKLVKARSAG